MLRQSVSVTILGLLVAGALPTCNKSEKIAAKEESSEPCKQADEQLNAERLMLDNYALQKEVESLKSSLEAEKAKNQAKKNRENDKMDAEDKENKRAQLENQKQIERQHERTKLQSSSLSLKELSKIFDRQSKTEVQYMLGDPDKLTKPSAQDTFYYEIWEYRNKVQDSDKGPKKPLFIFFDKETVTRIETSNSSK